MWCFCLPINASSQIDFTAIRSASDHERLWGSWFETKRRCACFEIICFQQWNRLGKKRGKKWQLLKKSSRGKVKTKETLSSKERKHPQKYALKKIQVGWHHYNEDLKRHVAVRLAKGGGTRELTVPLSATEDDMIDFERRTATGSGRFSFLICFDTAILVLLKTWTLIETICFKILMKTPPKNGKSPHPVAVRRSKKLLIELPIKRCHARFRALTVNYFRSAVTCWL